MWPDVFWAGVFWPDVYWPDNDATYEGPPARNVLDVANLNWFVEIR